MGIIIFFSLGIIEIVYAITCIIKKSSLIKERSLIRIASFLIFLFLVLLSVIKWGPSYYLLTFYLFISAIIGFLKILRGQLDNGNYSTKKLLFKTFALLILIFIVTVPAILFPQDKLEIETTGRYKILSNTYTYIDEKRDESYSDDGENRKLNIQFWYPDNQNDIYPLIVFSHGSLGVKSSNESLYGELASHGYVVCSIDHTYQCFYTIDDKGSITFIDLGYMQELSNEDSLADPKNSYELYQRWMGIRMGDINFVIDKIKEKAEVNEGDMVYSIIDTKRIGVMGHSLGGSAALGIGRVRDDISAVIALEAPFMYDIEGVEEGLFVFNDDIYPLPLLNIYSDSSRGILDKRPQYATNYKMLSDFNEESYNILLSGTGHMGLTDFAITSPILTNFLDRGKSSPDNTVNILKRINKECLEFFDNYLKSDL